MALAVSGLHLIGDPG